MVKSLFQEPVSWPNFLKKPLCSEGQRYCIITTISPLHCNSYIIINTHYFHKESKGILNNTNKSKNPFINSTKRYPHLWALKRYDKYIATNMAFREGRYNGNGNDQQFMGVSFLHIAMNISYHFSFGIFQLFFSLSLKSFLEEKFNGW